MRLPTQAALSFPLCLSVAFAAPGDSPGDAPGRQLGRIELTSGNRELQEGFRWAKARALELVVPANARKGDSRWLFHDRDQRVTRHFPFRETSPGPEWKTDQVLRQYDPSEVGSAPKPTLPSYWGTYAYRTEDADKGWWLWQGGRECFCTRDICHQAAGAHLLGLDLENWTMLRHFAAGANVNQDSPHWPKWSYDFFGNPYYMDAGWRELPAPLELGEKLYEQYLWTGDRAYVEDPEVFTYQSNLHSVFMEHQDVNHNGIADETRQLATLWEDTQDKFIEAGDSLGCQYQALLAFAGTLEARGDAEQAKIYRAKADALRGTFHQSWYNPDTRRYLRGFNKDGVGKDNWGHECSFFMPMKLVTDQGPRTAAYLDFIFLSAHRKELNIEAKTYLPEVFYKHGRNGMGWHYLAQVMRSRNIYPEVAFTTLSNTVCGLMGVQADAPAGRVASLPRLTAPVPWVACDHIKVGGRDLMLRHDGCHRSELALHEGTPLIWTARFPGIHARIKVDGQWQAATAGSLNGQPVSSVEIPLKAGQRAVAEVAELAVTVLSSLTPKSTASTVVRDGLPDGRGLMMADGRFVERALSLRGHGARAAFELPPCTRFTAELGVDDSSPGGAEVEFIFLVNGEVAHKTGPLSRGARVPVEISLLGATTLEVGIAGSSAPYALVIDGLLHHGAVPSAESAASVAAGLLLPGQAKDAKVLLLPKVPAGFRIAIKESSDPAMVNTSGMIAPPELATLVNLLLEIRKSDGTAACTVPLTTLIPARTPESAPLAAKCAEAPPSPVHGQSRLPAPSVPPGFSIRLVSSSDPAVVALDGSLHPAADYQTITLVYEVTRDRDRQTARTGPLEVTVPAADFLRLDKLAWTQARADSGEPAKGFSYVGSALRLAGQDFKTGIGTHANSEIHYSLDGRYRRLKIMVGVDDAQREAGSVQFEILGDGRSLAKSAVLRGTADNAARTATLDADLSGVKELILRASDGGDGISSDHADWVDGRLYLK